MSDQSTEAIILRLYQAGKSYSDIRSLVKVDNNKICEVISFASKNNGRVLPRKTRGRPRKLTPALVQLIDVISIQNAKMSDSGIARELDKRENIQVSRCTVNRAHQILHYKWRPPKKEQFLTQMQINKRLSFVDEITSLNRIDFAKLVFSDESRFVQANDSHWIWARKGITNPSQFIQERGYPRGIMIWGAIGVGFKSQLIIVEGNIDSDKYLSILHESHLIRDCNMKYGLRNWTFMQDGAPAHTSSTTLNYLRHLVNILEGWPPNSCDLNPIEVLWGVIKQFVKRNNPTDIEDLKRLVKLGWELVPQSIIDRLVLSFNARCQAVVQEGGKSIMQRLRSHELPEYNGNIRVLLMNVVGRNWTHEEDQQILSDFENFGRNFRLMSKIGRAHV